MAKYTFSYSDEYGHAVVHTFDTTDAGETWHDVLPYFEEFLRGIGFKFDGEIAMVEEETSGVGQCGAGQCAGCQSDHSDNW